MNKMKINYEFFLCFPFECDLIKDMWFFDNAFQFNEIAFVKDFRTHDDIIVLLINDIHTRKMACIKSRRIKQQLLRFDE